MSVMSETAPTSHFSMLYFVVATSHTNRIYIYIYIYIQTHTHIFYIYIYIKNSLYVNYLKNEIVLMVIITNINCISFGEASRHPNRGEGGVA